MRLILTRHGETEENKLGIHMGWMPGNLSEEGKLQAKKLARELKDTKIDIIYTSDLKRCTDTADTIFKYHPDAIFIKEQKLRENNHGEFQGRKVEESEWAALGGDIFTNRPKGGETFEELWQRLEIFYKELLKKYKDETNKVILIVGHGGSMCLLQGLIMQKKLRESLDLTRLLGNTAYSIFDIDKKGNAKVICVNSSAHFD
jgi:broad specificity phosphatase PhoE